MTTHFSPIILGIDMTNTSWNKIMISIHQKLATMEVLIFVWPPFTTISHRGRRSEYRDWGQYVVRKCHKNVKTILPSPNIIYKQSLFLSDLFDFHSNICQSSDFWIYNIKLGLFEGSYLFSSYIVCTIMIPQSPSPSYSCNKYL